MIEGFDRLLPFVVPSVVSAMLTHLPTIQRRFIPSRKPDIATTDSANSCSRVSDEWYKSEHATSALCLSMCFVGDEKDTDLAPAPREQHLKMEIISTRPLAESTKSTERSQGTSQENHSHLPVHL